jgi:hypothetical protein
VRRLPGFVTARCHQHPRLPSVSRDKASATFIDPRAAAFCQYAL